MENLTIEHSEEELLSKHRKEKKDLQAKIQNIKKTSDKKKKKEIAELIARLEDELKTQQQNELDKLNTQKPDNNEVSKQIDESLSNSEPIEDSCEVNEPRITKAQRRRNKKSEQEKERLRLIAEQETVNETGARNIEMQKLKKILKSLGLISYTVPSNGDCLYTAILHQLKISNHITYSFTVQDLRNKTADYLHTNKDDILPFMSTEDGDFMSNEAFDNYLQQTRSKAWGGQVELKALAEILKCPIKVIQAEGPPNVLGEQFQLSPLTITYHRHMYGLGEHYNSTKPEENEEDENE